MNEQLKIQRRVLSLDVYGKEYELRMPSSKQRNDFMGKLDTTDMNLQYEMMCEYLALLGLPKEICYEIEDGDILDVLEVIHTKKKK